MGLRLYNLFPRYYDNCLQWAEVFPHIRGMGFNAVYINPFHYAGFSGSLYAPKDYYSLNPICIDAAASAAPMDQLKDTLARAHGCGLKVIMDLVINHTSKDHPFVQEHSAWYVHDAQGQVQSPGAWENGRWVAWGDLAQLDNVASSDKESLWAYWEALLLFYIDLGFDGFRADAAYQIPVELWRRLIQKGKSRKPGTLFLAESLGCTPPQSMALAEAGFDYLFNSAKWWDFSESWFLEQYNAIQVPTIAFPESHDTRRAADEYADPALLKRLIAFTGLISASWMIISGTEWAWIRKTDVVHTLPSDKEPVHLNLAQFISEINTLRGNTPLLQDPVSLVLRDHERRATVLALEKVRGTEGLFYLINKTGVKDVFSTFNVNDFLGADKVKFLFSSAGQKDFTSEKIPVAPWEFKMFYFVRRSSR